MRQIILDTETTGLDPKAGHKIIEFAGLEMVDRKLTGNSLHLYMQPEREIDPEAQRVHGISLADLEGKPLFAEVADQIVDYLRDAELIIHNAAFDVNFLNYELNLVKRPKIDAICPSVIDTLKKAREMFPGKKNNLDALCDRFDVDRSNRTLHGALIDCALLSDVYLAMTREQGRLDMGSQNDDTHIAIKEMKRLDNLLVLKADEAELQAHSEYIARLDKTVGGSCLYRRQENETYG